VISDHVASFDVTQLMLQSVMSLSLIAVVILITHRQRKRIEEALQWIGPVSAIIETFSTRLNRFQDDVARLRGEVDILEHRLAASGLVRSKSIQVVSAESNTQKEAMTEPAAEGKEVGASLGSDRSVTASHHITGAMAVLRILESGPKTASQVSQLVGKSREHTSRLLKSLTEQGLVRRAAGRPYVYSLTPKGSETLKKQ